MKLPFKEQQLEEGVFIRTFSQQTDLKDLVWHRDREDRIIESLHQTDWMIQIDDQLPKKLEGKIFIAKNVYHRLIKGANDLKVMIKKV